jgi:hypothetical protein
LIHDLKCLSSTPFFLTEQKFSFSTGMSSKTNLLQHLLLDLGGLLDLSHGQSGVGSVVEHEDADLHGGRLEGVPVLEAVGHQLPLGQVVEPGQLAARVDAGVEVLETGHAAGELERKEKVLGFKKHFNQISPDFRRQP